VPPCMNAGSDGMHSMSASPGRFETVHMLVRRQARHLTIGQQSKWKEYRFGCLKIYNPVNFDEFKLSGQNLEIILRRAR
jgi:hypothetical protein